MCMHKLAAGCQIDPPETGILIVLLTAHYHAHTASCSAHTASCSTLRAHTAVVTGWPAAILACRGCGAGYCCWPPPPCTASTLVCRLLLTRVTQPHCQPSPQQQQALLPALEPPPSLPSAPLLHSWPVLQGRSTDVLLLAAVASSCIHLLLPAAALTLPPGHRRHIVWPGSGTSTTQQACACCCLIRSVQGPHLWHPSLRPAPALAPPLGLYPCLVAWRGHPQQTAPMCLLLLLPHPSLSSAPICLAFSTWSA